jgi:hypothetical protein
MTTVGLLVILVVVLGVVVHHESVRGRLALRSVGRWTLRLLRRAVTLAALAALIVQSVVKTRLRS